MRYTNLSPLLRGQIRIAAERAVWATVRSDRSPRSVQSDIRRAFEDLRRDADASGLWIAIARLSRR